MWCLHHLVRYPYSMSVVLDYTVDTGEFNMLTCCYIARNKREGTPLITKYISSKENVSKNEESDCDRGSGACGIWVELFFFLVPQTDSMIVQTRLYARVQTNFVIEWVPTVNFLIIKHGLHSDLCHQVYISLVVWWFRNPSFVTAMLRLASHKHSIVPPRWENKATFS